MPSATTISSRLCAEADDRAGDRRLALVEADPRDERAVDLEHVDRERGEVAQRGVAGAEVVDGEPDAELLELAHPLGDGVGDRAGSAVSVSSSTSRSGGEPALVERPARRRRPGRSPRTARSEKLTLSVSSASALVLARQRAACMQAASQDPAPEREHQAAVLGDRDELAGQQQAAGRVLPADQRLDPDQPLGCAARGSAGSGGRARRSRSACASALLELDPLDHRRVHLRLEDLLLALALRLRPVEREVGVAQQVVGLVAADRDPDAGADEDLATLDPERLVHRLEDAVATGRRAARRRPRAGRRTRRRRSAPRCRRRGCSEVSLVAASHSSSSPAAWPRLSLTFLNMSRSTNRTATRVPARRRAPARARAGRSAAGGWAAR